MYCNGKYIKSFVLIFTFSLSFISQTIYADAISDVLSTVTIVTEDYPPDNYLENGKPTGLATEILQEVLKKLDIHPAINTYPWERAYKLALENPNVLIYSISRTLEREHLFKWVIIDIPYEHYIYKLKKRTDIVTNTLEDTKKYIIEAVKEDVSAMYLKKHKYPKIDYRKEYVNTKMLINNRIDLILTSDISLNYILKSSPLKMSDFEKLYPIKDLDVNLCFAFSRGTDDKVVALFQSTLNEVKQTPRYKEIIDKYMN